MCVLIQVSIGTHEITLWPEGESLRVQSTWHQAVTIHDWTMAKLMRWANDAENDGDYVAAEAAFIIQATGQFAKLKRP